ncbi:hypothetical protein ACLM45_12780 [Synechococcus sp. A10-1-5-9]|uniref:hypothetical protein n=1 Tax=Synechococcus sp. A10-1-5-9 TaxID=3392295 RepID=UPI0039EA620D
MARTTFKGEIMDRSVRQRRFMDAAEALALTIADANLKPSEMLDAGAALGQGSRALSSRSVAMDQ